MLSHLTPEGFDYFFRNGGRTLFRQFQVEIPVVLALNGPARIHTEFFFGADIVLVSEGATISDTNHLSVGYAIGASGIAWEYLAGPMRARRLIFGFEEMTAAETSAAGLACEVLPQAELMPRARALALELSRLPLATSRALRLAFHQGERLAYARDYAPGAGLLGLSLLDRTAPPTPTAPHREPGLRGAA